MTDTTQDNIIRLPEVKKRVGLCTTAIYNKMKKQEFPKQIKLGSASGWSEQEISEWIDARKAARNLPPKASNDDQNQQAT